MKFHEQRRGNFHLIAKPAGPLCNLDCQYCFYTEKEALFPEGTNFRMPDEVLKTFIREYIRSQKAPEIPFVWQGGEPTLMGSDVYKKVVALQGKYAGGKKIHNAIQTNGILLNEEWCKFLAENGFLVGLSLDGPPEIHDHFRVKKGGQPTAKKVLKALRLLQEYDVPYNVLACVTKQSASRGLEIYRFFKDQGVRYIQFIPIVERLPDTKAEQLGLRHAVPPVPENDRERTNVSPWTVGAEQYGDFLIEIFDEWVRKDVGNIHVINFEWAVAAWMGLPSSVCLFSETCGNAGIIEHNGDVYSCDHYMYPDYKLGNILEESLKRMMMSPKQKKFGLAKKETLPGQCRTCEVKFACYGECPKHRFLRTEDGEPGLNYLCAGYKKFFHHIHPYMKVIVQLIENGLPASYVMDAVKGPLIIKK